jgi:hypothetical protein
LGGDPLPQQVQNGLTSFVPAFPGEGEKGNMASALDRMGQLALMARARAGLAAWADFTIFAHKPAKQIDRFVIDQDSFICAELANFRPGDIPTPTTAKLLVLIIHIISHGTNSI